MFFSILLHSQWKYEVVNDPFQGEYEIAYATGYDGSFPYNNPSIGIIKRNSEVEIAITGAGYSGCDNPYFDVSFGNPDEVISLNGTPNVENDAMFMSSFNSDIDILDFLNGLKNKSLVYIKYGTDCNANVFKVSLKGSSSQIDKVAGEYISNLEKKYQTSLLNKERELEYSSLKQERYLKLIETLPKFRRKNLSMGDLEEIMRSHWTKNYQDYSPYKNSVDILDIDSISLSPAILDCWKRVTIYDFDLPEDKQQFISFYYEVRLDDCEM